MDVIGLGRPRRPVGWLTRGRRSHAAAAATLVAGVAWAATPSRLSAQTQTFTFSDATFANADWELLVGPSGAGAFTGGQSASGGNPGSYMRTNIFGASPQAQVGNVRTAASFNPATQGTVAQLTWTWDTNVFTGVPVDALVFPVIKQNNTYYSSIGGGTFPSTGWHSFPANSATAANNFSRFAGAGPVNPVWTRSGGPMQFGYGVFYFNSGDVSVGVDNYSMGVTATAQELSTSGNVAFGNTLVGTSKNVGLTATNTGLPGSTLTGTFPANTGDGYATPGTQAFALGQNQSATRQYTFAPTVRTGGSIGHSGTVVSDANDVNVSFTGRAVAPILSVATANANAGDVRLGTSGPAGVVVSNTGDGNLSGQGIASNLLGSAILDAGDGQFAEPGGTVINLADNTSQTISRTFTPTGRGTVSRTLRLSFSNGNANGTNTAQTVTTTLQARGVGPIATSSGHTGGVVNVGSTVAGVSRDAPLTITNASTDHAANEQSRLTLLGYALTGADAALFAVPELDDDGVVLIGDEESAVLRPTFSPSAGAAQRTYTATLRVTTDQNAALNAPGDVLTFTLTGTVVPEPTAAAALPLLAAGLLVSRRGRRRAT